MAYKKTQTPADSTPNEVVENAAPSTEAETTEKKVGKQAVIDVPEKLMDTMEVFSNLEYLYINNKGSVFAEGTPEALMGQATLYKNPFFES